MMLKHVSRLAALGMGILVVGGTGAAFAQWKATPPRSTCVNGHIPRGSSSCVNWSPAWGGGKQGMPFMEGQWRYECQRDHGQGNAYTPAPGAYMAVYQYNPGWIYAQCYVGHMHTRHGYGR